MSTADSDIGARPLWQHFLAFFREKPAIFGAVLYIYVSVVGLLFNLILFLHFDIYILDYYNITDFLISGLRQPFLLVVFISVPSVLIVVSFGFEYLYNLQAKFAKYIVAKIESSTNWLLVTLKKYLEFLSTLAERLWWLGHFMIVSYATMGVLLSVVLVWVWAEKNAFQIHSSPMFQVSLKGNSENQAISRIFLIGSTQDLLFFKHECIDRVTVVPIGEIQQITIEESSKPRVCDERQVLQLPRSLLQH